MGRTERMLRWLYAGRLVVAAAIFVAALARWLATGPYQLETLIATIALLSAVAVTGAGVWWVEIRGRAPGPAFLYGQHIYDVFLVTAVVHVTGGSASPYPPLYILVITAAALMLPLPGGLLIGALASLLFIGDVALLQLEDPARVDLLRVALFSGVAVATAAIGDLLRRTDAALGEVESELREFRLETQDILAALDTAVVTVDGGGRLAYVNAAASHLLGITQEEWAGRPILEEMDRSAPGLGALIRRTAATRTPVRRFEIRKRSASGDRYFGVRTTVLERRGDASVTAVFQDITEGRRNEDLKRRADRLEALAELGASLAHEIRNPLASIRSAVEQLDSDRLARQDRAMLRRLVVTESERVSRLLADFMEFSRVETRRWSTLDMADVASDAIDLVLRHPDRPGDTRIDFARPAVPLLLKGDPDLLHRAVFNLVLNAVQHAGAAGTVTVELAPATDNVPPGVQVESPLRLVIRDTGPGLREEDIPRMFDPFFTTREGGTGLGLALVHRAVEAHRGAILVDNVNGSGARFTIYLPAHAGAEATRALQRV
jgi:two-component system, NtrC family, sensor histidine kinase PilS